MAVLIRPKRWRYAPSTAQVNGGHPLAKGLLGVWLLGESGVRPLDLITGQWGARTGSAASQSANKTQLGAGIHYFTNSPTSGTLLGASTSDYNIGSDPMTVSCYSTLAPTTSALSVCSRAASSTGYEILHGTTTTGFRVQGASAALTPTFTTPASPAEGMVTGTYSPSAAEARSYLNGVLQATASGTTGSITNTQTLAIALRGSTQFIGRVGFVAVHRRALTADEVAWLAAEPYAMLVPPAPVRRYWIPASSTVSASGTASLDLTASGTAAAPVTSSASLSLSAAGTTQAPAAPSASLVLTATGTAQAPITAAATLTLTGAGTTQAPLASTGTLDLTAAGTVAAQVTASALLELAAAGIATVFVPTVRGYSSGTVEATSSATGTVVDIGGYNTTELVTVGASSGGVE